MYSTRMPTRLSSYQPVVDSIDGCFLQPVRASVFFFTDTTQVARQHVAGVVFHQAATPPSRLCTPFQYRTAYVPTYSSSVVQYLQYLVLYVRVLYCTVLSTTQEPHNDNVISIRSSLRLPAHPFTHISPPRPASALNFKHQTTRSKLPLTLPQRKMTMSLQGYAAPRHATPFSDAALAGKRTRNWRESLPKPHPAGGAIDSHGKPWEATWRTPSCRALLFPSIPRASDLLPSVSLADFTLANHQSSLTGGQDTANWCASDQGRRIGIINSLLLDALSSITGKWFFAVLSCWDPWD